MCRVGDTLGFSDRSWESSLIAVGTWGWPWVSITHVGISGSHDGEPYVFEARHGAAWCHIQKKFVAGVTATPLRIRLEQHRGAVWHYQKPRPLQPWVADELNDWLHRKLGTAYDYRQAFGARGLLLGWLLRLLSRDTEEDEDVLFCVELAGCGLELAKLVPEAWPLSRMSPRWFCHDLVAKAGFHKPKRLRSEV